MRRIGIRLPLLLVCFVIGCTTGDRSSVPEEVVWRLVDWPSVEASPAPPFARAPAAVELGPSPFAIRGPSRATIDDDQRYTFRRAEFEFVYRDRTFVVPVDENVSIGVGLPEVLRPCDVLTVEVTLTSIAASIVQRVTGRCTGPPDAQHLEVEVPSPLVLRGTPVDFWVHARRPSPQGIRQRRFTIPKVPDGARLVFGYGIESPGWEEDAAAATFHVLIEGSPKPLFSARLDPVVNASQRRWFEASIDLTPYVGKRLPLVLQTAIDRAPDRRPFSRPVWGNPTVRAARRAETPQRPLNVILVSLDTLRARSVGAYGRERTTTPFLDDLARQGVLFTQAVAQSTTTPQSHMSLFTSLYPSTHGITDLALANDLTAYPTLAEILRAHGYVTGAVTEDGLLQASLGFERGFDAYNENKNADLEAAVGQIETTFHQAVTWVEKQRDIPFFLFVHTYQVQDPYTPPAPYAGMFGPTDVDGPDAELDRYEEEVRYADDQMAKLWASIKSLGVADRTLMIVTADHGEEFGEHGLLRHGSDLYDETLLVPLVMRAPGLLPRGTRIDSQVGLIDVVPTLLDLLGLPPIERAQGRSLAALFRGDSADRDHLAHELTDRELFAEAWGGIRVRSDGSIDEDWHPPIYARRTQALKVIYDPIASAQNPSTGLLAFDLTTDPLERDRKSTVVDGAREALLRYAGAQPRPAVQPAGLAAPDATTAEKLRALGYVR